MSDDSLLSRMDELVSLVDEAFTKQPSVSQQNLLSVNNVKNVVTDPDDEKKYDNDNKVHPKIGGLSLGNVNGKYIYQRFGYQSWTELAFKLEAVYNLNHDKDEQKDPNNSSSSRSKKKKKN